MLTGFGSEHEAVEAIGFPAALKPRVSHAFARHFAGKAVVVDEVGTAEATFRQMHEKGIEVVLADAQVMDTIIHSAATVLRGFPDVLAAEGMFVFQTTLNFFVPSGSGQAAVTMPLMAPLADVLGLSRQTAVFAFTCGDGFSNSIIPTSGLLMAMLGLAKIPYEKWLRFVFPLFLMLSGLAALFLAIAVWTGY